MKSQLFYTAHQLVEAGPKQAVSWFAVACYYHLLDKNELAQRYFLKVGYGHGECVRGGGGPITHSAQVLHADPPAQSLPCGSRLADHTTKRFTNGAVLHPNTLTLPELRNGKTREDRAPSPKPRLCRDAPWRECLVTET